MRSSETTEHSHGSTLIMDQCTVQFISKGSLKARIPFVTMFKFLVIIDLDLPDT
jgi:hypothetical protein